MELKHIKGIGPAKQAKLNEAGIADVETMAQADVAAVVGKTGFSETTVKEYKERAVALVLLRDMRGIGPATVQTLAEAGVRSLKDLYEASAERLAKEAEVARERVQEWQQEAKRVMEHVREGSRTPEGRRRLAQEGKDLAVTSARKAQEATAELIERLQRDGEAALQKAQQLRQEAPEKAKEYRAKAEELIAGADAMRRELQAKGVEIKEQTTARIHEVQVKVRQEAEKVRAANEGLLSRIRARFGRGRTVTATTDKE